MRHLGYLSSLVHLVGGGLQTFVLRPERFDLAFRSGRMLRRRRATTYFPNGLNGKRAVARRLRQIESGRLTVANGLCPEVRS